MIGSSRSLFTGTLATQATKERIDFLKRNIDGVALEVLCWVTN